MVKTGGFRGGGIRQPGQVGWAGGSKEGSGGGGSGPLNKGKVR